MTKEELSRAYTHKKVAEKIVSDISEFMPSDIIQAYEDGYDKAVEIAREEVIEKACDWLENNVGRWIDMDYDQKAFVEEFKQAMEEQV